MDSHMIYNYCILVGMDTDYQGEYNNHEGCDKCIVVYPGKHILSYSD